MSTHSEKYARAVAAELRAERAAQEVSLRGLEARTGHSYSALHKYLSGQRILPLHTFMDICEGLSVSPVEISTRAEARLARDGQRPPG